MGVARQGGASDVSGRAGFVVWGGVRWGVVCGWSGGAGFGDLGRGSGKRTSPELF